MVCVHEREVNTGETRRGENVLTRFNAGCILKRERWRLTEPQWRCWDACACVLYNYVAPFSVAPAAGKEPRIKSNFRSGFIWSYFTSALTLPSKRQAFKIHYTYSAEARTCEGKNREQERQLVYISHTTDTEELWTMIFLHIAFFYSSSCGHGRAQEFAGLYQMINNNLI